MHRVADFTRAFDRECVQPDLGAEAIDACGLELRQKNTSLPALIGVDERDYAPHGGCFPIKLRGTGCVGTGHILIAGSW